MFSFLEAKHGIAPQDCTKPRRQRRKTLHLKIDHSTPHRQRSKTECEKDSPQPTDNQLFQWRRELEKKFRVIEEEDESSEESTREGCKETVSIVKQSEMSPVRTLHPLEDRKDPVFQWYTPSSITQQRRKSETPKVKKSVQPKEKRSHSMPQLTFHHMATNLLPQGKNISCNKTVNDKASLAD